MGFVYNKEDFNKVIEALKENYRIYAPVLKVGEGRFRDTDVIRYDYIDRIEDAELETRSDFSFKEILIPLSETLFFFTENEIKEADYDATPVIVLMRSCDIHAVKRLDQMYTGNGPNNDWFYERLRDRVKFALIGCGKACPNSFCVDMGSNKTDEYAFSIDVIDDKVFIDLKDDELAEAFGSADSEEKAVEPRFVTKSEFQVTRPEEVPIELFKDEMWDEYTKDQKIAALDGILHYLELKTDKIGEPIPISDENDKVQLKLRKPDFFCEGFNSLAEKYKNNYMPIQEAINITNLVNLNETVKEEKPTKKKTRKTETKIEDEIDDEIEESDEDVENRLESIFNSKEL